MMYQVMLETEGLVGFATPWKTALFEKFSRKNVKDVPQNAPWDFHVTYFDVTLGNSNVFKARIVYKPWDNIKSAKKK